MERTYTDGSASRRSRTITATAAGAIAVLVASLGLMLGVAGPASASPGGSQDFPTSPADCRHGGWRHFDGVHFRNQGRCVRWVRHLVRRDHCLPAVLEEFADTGATYADELGISLRRFLRAVCHGQDFPVSNASFAINDPAGTDLLSLASGNTTAFVTQPGHIYWIQVQGAWYNGASQQADARYVSDDDWSTWSEGPAPDPRNLDTQVNDQFVNWGAYDTGHHYSFWIVGDGNPINMRVFEGNVATNTPDAAAYADNTGWVAPGSGATQGLPAIVFEYALPTP